MQINQQEMEMYRKRARERAQKRQVELDERRQQAWIVARSAAEILKTEFGATRVVLFGSLLQPQLFHSRSDVDLAAWGLESYFQAVARLIDLNPEIEVNLMPIEDVRPELQVVIKREGIEL